MKKSKAEYAALKAARAASVPLTTRAVHDAVAPEAEPHSSEPVPALNGAVQCDQTAALTAVPAERCQDARECCRQWSSASVCCVCEGDLRAAFDEGQRLGRERGASSQRDYNDDVIQWMKIVLRQACSRIADLEILLWHQTQLKECLQRRHPETQVDLPGPELPPFDQEQLKLWMDLSHERTIDLPQLYRQKRAALARRDE